MWWTDFPVLLIGKSLVPYHFWQNLEQSHCKKEDGRKGFVRDMLVYTTYHYFLESLDTRYVTEYSKWPWHLTLTITLTIDHENDLNISPWEWSWQLRMTLTFGIQDILDISSRNDLDHWARMTVNKDLNFLIQENNLQTELWLNIDKLSSSTLDFIRSNSILRCCDLYSC